MTDSSAWSAGNTGYLRAAIAWLRALLAAYAMQHEEPNPQLLPPAPVSNEPSQSRSWRNFIHRTEPGVTPLAALPAPTPVNVRQAADAMHQAETAIDPPPALLILGQRLGLSAFEQMVLLLAVSVELDSETGTLCARCQQGLRAPTFALAFSIFENPSWDALSADHPLRYWRLIEISPGGAQPLTTSPIRVDERILSYALGLNTLDDRLAPYVTPVELNSTAQPLPASHATVVETIVSRLREGEASKALPVIQLLGSDAATKKLITAEIARSLDLQLYSLTANLLPAPADLDILARLWQRETLLMPLVLHIEMESAAEPPSAAMRIIRFADSLNGAIFLDTRESVSGLSRHSVLADVTKATATEQQIAWQNVLGPEAGELPSRLADQFSLDLRSIERIAQEGKAAAGGDIAQLGPELWKACLLACRPKLDGLAQRVEPKATWEQLVLPENELNLLRSIAEQVAHRNTVYEKWGFAQKLTRGLGISALFAGDSGTGKTMAAEVIANQLQLGLHRIDLSAVVSKYIGETEKNLRQLFDNAENGGAILFFDEADALFGKRSEVKDSHDRYANIEINYLLQRMESYRGLAILATNAKSAIDPAFLRRLRFVVNFPFPGVAERKAIWQKIFPAGVPLDALNYDALARLNLAGGHIYNIALNAAFLAARAKTPVTLAHIFDAARTELRKLERPVNELDFRIPATSQAVPSKGAAA